jgi:cytochrome c-type biogenesis protein CcmF
LVSVHSFAADPARGLFILGLLVFYIGGALIVYALKASDLDTRGGFEVTSRETFLLLNNALLVATTALILLGTLWPLVLEVFKWGQISVGPPYFNVAFMIPMLPLVFLASVGMHAAWQRGALGRRSNALKWIVVLSVALGLGIDLVVYHSPLHLLTVVGFAAGLMIILSSSLELWAVFSRRQRLSLSVLGMVLAHIGIGVFTLGVSGVSSFAIEKDVSLAQGEQVAIGDYQFKFLGTLPVKGPNYDALAGRFELTHGAQSLAILQAEKRVFHAGGSPMTHAAIYTTPTRDLFVALGEDLGANRYSLRLQYKPLVRLIWWGGVLMALGGVCAMLDRRYRHSTSTVGAA